jgi:hypothetical protein
MLIACLLASAGASFLARAQTEGPKPAPAVEKPQDSKEKPAPPPRSDRASRKRDASGEERPRADVPVSFPVDI